MADMIWLNGETIPMSQARIDPEDRGFQFADGVYEVIRLYAGKSFTLEEHLQRLEKSAAGIELPVPLPRGKLKEEILRFTKQTGAGECMVYLQLTRGHAERNHVFPPSAGGTLLFYTHSLEPLAAPESRSPAKLMTVADERWKRCWIKSIALLPNVLAKNAAVNAGADEAVFVDEGIVTECAASNFLAVIGGKLITHPVGPKVLPGVTRAVLLDCAKELNIPVVERPMRLEEAQQADEIFITSTTREISTISHWDGRPVAKSREITLRLHNALRQRIAQETK